MPELPEVETIRRQLDKYLVGQKIAYIESLHKKSLVGDMKEVLNAKITGVKRLGKMLVMEMSNNYVIAIHLKMSGQLILTKNNKQETRNKNDKHIRVKINFLNGNELLFIDQRIFGWVRIMKKEELKTMGYVKNLGPEPWDITDIDFYKKLQKKSKAIKIILTDQDVISGVGNIYANDALWEAGIDPRTSANTLKPDKVKILRKMIIKVLKEGIKLGGSTGQDGKYVNLEGEPGSYQDRFRVYDRDGEGCQRRDGGVIQKIKLGGRGTYFCPKCQM